MAPRRAKRPQEEHGVQPVCPFCPSHEVAEEEVYRIPSLASQGQALQGWQVLVLKNKYPFVKVHEVIIHSPNHHKNFDTLPFSQTELILQTYQHRYNEHSHEGQVYIFHNRGAMGGESLSHPHSQLTVVPFEVKLDISTLESVLQNPLILNTKYFILSCPKTSQWPDEVWIVPTSRGKTFGEITNKEISDLAKILPRLIQIFDHRHGNDFPFNFYIYPGTDWYLRIIPRLKSLGGFELGTNIYVNTQDPKQTMAFIREHFEEPNVEKIKIEAQAEYERRV